MKLRKVRNILLPAMVIIGSSVYAQSATGQGTDPNAQASNEEQMNISYRRLENAVPVKNEDVPEKLRSTLNGDQQYKGWEDSQLLYSQGENIYELRMGAGDEAVVFYFDKDGRAVRNR